MHTAAFIFLGFPAFCNCVIYIDRVSTETYQKYANVTIAFKHDKAGNYVVNTTITTLMKILKLRVYLKLVAKEDQEYRQELLRTVIDVAKLANDLQRNIILGNFMKDLKKAMDFELKFPLMPVSVSLKLSDIN